MPEQVARLKCAGMNGHVGKPFRADELLAAVNAALPATIVPTRAPAFADLLEALGSSQAAALLSKLEAELHERFRVPDEARVDRAAIAADAHALVSAAGMLGFDLLSDRCRALETACGNDGPLDALLEEVRETIGRVLAQITQLKRSLEAA